MLGWPGEAESRRNGRAHTFLLLPGWTVSLRNFASPTRPPRQRPPGSDQSRRPPPSPQSCCRRRRTSFTTCAPTNGWRSSTCPRSSGRTASCQVSTSHDSRRRNLISQSTNDNGRLYSALTLSDSTLLPSPPSSSAGAAPSLSDLLFALPTPLPTTAPKQNGSPHVVILASSGQRCADLVRELRALIPGSTSTGGPPDDKAKVGAAKKGKKTGPAGRGEIAKVGRPLPLGGQRWLHTQGN